MTTENGLPGMENLGSVEAAVSTSEGRVNGVDAAPAMQTPAPQTEPEPLSDFEALQKQVAELQATNTKQEQQIKTMDGRYRRLQTDTAKMDDVADGIGMLTDLVKVQIRHQDHPDESAFTEDLQKLETETQQRRSTDSFARAIGSMTDEIMNGVQEAGLDLTKSEELGEFRDKWSQAYDKKDMAGIYEAYALYSQALRQHERTMRRQVEEQAESQAVERVRKALEDAGINDLDSGSGAPSSMTNSTLMGRLGNPDVSVTREEILKGAEMLRNPGRRF